MNEDRICTRCGAINPEDQEDCWLGAEIPDGGTEPHAFQNEEKVQDE